MPVRDWNCQNAYTWSSARNSQRLDQQNLGARWIADRDFDPGRWWYWIRARCSRWRMDSKLFSTTVDLQFRTSWTGVEYQTSCARIHPTCRMNSWETVGHPARLYHSWFYSGSSFHWAGTSCWTCCWSQQKTVVDWIVRWLHNGWFRPSSDRVEVHSALVRWS